MFKPILALLSWMFITVAKPIISYFYRQQMKHHHRDQWRCLSESTINAPWVLPYMMSHGPRLNPHAIIGLLGPLSVAKQLQVSLLDMQRSATEYSLVVYAIPSLATVASIGSNNGADEMTDDWHTFELPKGQYLLGLRYYHWQDQVHLPRIKIDQERLLQSEIQPATHLNQFHYQWSTNQQWLYPALNYYVYWLLRFRPWLPQEWVARQYLPVGNPDTLFRYDKIESGQILTLSMRDVAESSASDLLRRGDIFYCIYNQASLPVAFGQLTQTKLQVTSPTRGTFLIRLCCKQRQLASLWAKGLAINLS